jgi:hypothetical protein
MPDSPGPAAYVNTKNHKYLISCFEKSYAHKIAKPSYMGESKFTRFAVPNKDIPGPG